MKTVNANLTVAALTPEQKSRTCGYWYTVQNSNTAHTAFSTRRGLENYLQERNLKLSGELPDKLGEHRFLDVTGSYIQEMHLSYDEFYSLEPVLESRTLSNGDYTLAIITEDENGIRTVHTLNPNCKRRPVYNHRDSHQMMS